MNNGYPEYSTGFLPAATFLGERFIEDSVEPGNEQSAIKIKTRKM